MLDAKTYIRYEELVDWARKQGLSVPETLDRNDLLLTPVRHRNITITALEDMYRRLERQTANKLMSYRYGRVEGTAAEMFEAVKLWMETVINNTGAGTLSDI